MLHILDAIVKVGRHINALLNLPARQVKKGKKKRERGGRMKKRRIIIHKDKEGKELNFEHNNQRNHPICVFHYARR